VANNEGYCENINLSIFPGNALELEKDTLVDERNDTLLHIAASSTASSSLYRQTFLAGTQVPAASAYEYSEIPASERSHVVKQRSIDLDDPFFPFLTEMDYKIGNWARDANVTQRSMNEFFKIHDFNGSPYTVKSAKKLAEQINNIPYGIPRGDQCVGYGNEGEEEGSRD
jgi:hypothetical protein